MSDTIDISKLDKAEVLAALYNRSKQQGMGFMHARGSTGMTVDEAKAEIVAGDDHQRAYPEIMAGEKKRIRFDYLHGRVMKVELGGNTLDPWLYDRDNGEGAAERALQPLIDAAAKREERVAEGLDPESGDISLTHSEAFHASRGG